MNRHVRNVVTTLVAATAFAAASHAGAHAQTVAIPDRDTAIAVEAGTVDFVPAATTDKVPAQPAAPQIDLSAIDAQIVVPQSGADDPSGATTESTTTDDGASPNSTQDAVQDAIDPCWEVDEWQFYAIAGQSVVITMNRTWGNLDSYIELYNPYGQLRAVDDDSGGNQNSRLSGTIATTGNYVIRAHSFDYRTTGGYQLSVTTGSSGGCGGCPPPPCYTCDNGSVSVFTGAYYSGGSYTVRPGSSLSYPGGQATSIAFNGTCRNGGCYVVVYRYNGWTGQTQRAETLYSDQPYIGVTYDNAIEYVEVYRR